MQRGSPNRNFTAFMAGRYGADALGRFLSVCGCICILVSVAVRGKSAFFSAVFSAAALALLNDAVKKGGVMASSSVGGLSGAFIPVSEDEGMIAAVDAGVLRPEKLEAMTAVCSVGLDMIAVPGDTDEAVISGIIADEIAIGVANTKTTAVRIIPAVGKQAGDRLSFGGLLGEAPVMPVNNVSPAAFIRRGGRVPAPIHSLKN